MLAHAQDDERDTGPRHAAHGTERFCAATGAVKPVDEMIRFVIGPDGAPVPDLKRRLPGRGIWITATRQALRSAIGRKAFARGFKRDVRVAPDFVDFTERLIERAALDALAIAHKAGKVAIGFGKVEAALARDRVAGLLHAAEAAADGVRKVDAALRRQFGGDPIEAEKIVVISTFTSAQLGLALGRSNVIHAALFAGPESETFLARAARLDRFRTGGPGDGSGATSRSETPKNRDGNRDLNG
jgi:predicted RNA-binding protein YlxR (DUF448 family)